jgi:ribosomal protein S18 acetylase RimI-like enzyme
VLLPLVRGYRRFYGQAGDDDGERNFIRAHLEQGSSTIFVALAGDRAVGFVQVFQSWSTVHLAPACILEDLFVEEVWRGRGVARLLIDAAVTEVRGRGASGMFLETAKDNETAQRLYERAGWMREGRFLKYNAPL